MLALIDLGYFPNLYKLHRSPYLYLKTENRKRKTLRGKLFPSHYTGNFPISMSCVLNILL